MNTTTQTMKISDVRGEFDSIVERVHRGETRVLVEKSGIAVAALVSPDDLRRLAEIDARRDEAFEAMRQISRAFADVPVEELEDRVAQAVLEARAQLRAERAREAAVVE